MYLFIHSSSVVMFMMALNASGKTILSSRLLPIAT